MQSTKNYQTRQGAAILAALREVGGHATADALYTAMCEAGQRVGRTTVWRQLEKLVERGVVQKYPGAPGERTCYQYVGDADCGSHFHLKCTACGKLIHLECGHMQALAGHVAREHGFRVDRFRTVFYGLCADCAAKEGEKS